MEELNQINAAIENEHVRLFKNKGGRVFGYTCLYTPVEMFEALGILPYRIKALGQSETDLADARLSRFNCSFCRACLQLALDGSYDFLDGVIQSNGCDQLRGMYENWQYSQSQAFFHYLKIPHVISDESLEYFTLELQRLKEALENYLNQRLHNEALWRAIDNQERLRQRLRAFNALREQDLPQINGTTALALEIASGSLASGQFLEIADRYLSEAKTRPPIPHRARLLFGGAATDEIDLFSAVESLGGLIVADTLCFGTRAFWPISEHPDQGDPLRHLAELYLRHSLCPRMVSEFPARLDFILKAVKRAKIDGVILAYNKFCDIHGIDNVLLGSRLEQEGIPVLSLEKEYGASADHGRIKTRVQAFLERIEAHR